MLARVSWQFLAVCSSIDNTSVVLRRQFDRIGVVKTCHHYISVVADRVLRVDVVVIERIVRDSHLVAVVGLRRVAIG